MSWDTVTEFEQRLADYFQAPFCVTTDCATHAIELCLRLRQVRQTTCPRHTYLSVPMTLNRLNLAWSFRDEQWQDLYEFEGTGIYDAAVYWQQGGYRAGTMMCLSFQYQKTLSLGRGGAVLLDDPAAAERLTRLSCDGRSRSQPWKEQYLHIQEPGFRYYMTPETARLGLERLSQPLSVRSRGWQDYPDLSQAPIFQRT